MSTELIGMKLAQARMPNPLAAFTALPKLRPRARTNGTVTGPFEKRTQLVKNNQN